MNGKSRNSCWTGWYAVIALCAFFAAATIPLAQEAGEVKDATNVPAQALKQGGTNDLVVPAADQDDYRAYLDSRLKMKRAQLSVYQAQLEQAQAQRGFDQDTMLFEAGIISGNRVNDAKKNLDNSIVHVRQLEIDLEQVKAEMLDTASSIAVVEAKKYRTLDEKRMVDITLINDSLEGRIRAMFSDLTPDQFRALMTIHNIRVSLRDQAIIAEPYEQMIPMLGYGEKTNLTFQLLKDADDLAVDIRFGQRNLVPKVYLKKESQEAFPSIDSAQFAQEGSLGGKVKFDLMLEKLAEKDESFRLIAVNLPKQFDFSIVDPKTSAKVMQVKFSSSAPKQQLNLEIAIPEKLDSSFIDQTIVFYVMVLTTGELKTINDLREKYKEAPIDDAEINKIKGNKVRLELIPRGKGDLEIVSANRYQEIKIGEQPTIRIDLHNIGTLSVLNARVLVDAPYLWKDKIAPNLIPELKPGNKEPVLITLTPPADIGVGEYDIRVKAEAEVGTEKITALDKSISIRVGSKSNIMGNVILIGLLIALVVGIAVASIKISRR